MRAPRVLALFFGSAAILAAQSNNSVMLAGFGYAPPTSAVTVAPGQILTVSVYGIRAIDPALATPSPATTQPYPPISIDGIIVTLQQAGQAQRIAVPIYGIRQNSCSSMDTNCRVVSTFTLAIPQSLQTPADGSNPAALSISDQGTLLAGIPVHPVTDSIHVINSCDQTPIYVGVFSEVAGIPGGCTALVQHLDGRLVTDRLPAKLGETITIWAYGLGAVDPATVTHFGQTAPVQNVTLSFNVHANAPAIRPLLSDDVTHPITSVLVVAQGLYQLNIVVAPYLQGPFVPCDELHVQSNLTITLSGAASMDAAPICVAP
ncbi:MAG TPA: hypothetical protein VKU19_03905 [Bryobacteraceae bacterium]|nr:hypothetical protein [Bryobacteraceae bacterium]